MRTKLARTKNSLINGNCIAPNDSNLKTLKTTFTTLKSKLQVYEDLNTDASNKLLTAKNGITRRSLDFFKGEYPQFNRTDFAYSTDKYYRREFLSDVISITNALIVKVKNQIATVESDIVTEENNLSYLRDLYNKCLEGTTSEEAGKILAEQSEPTTTTTATTQTDYKKYILPLGILAGGYIIYQNLSSNIYLIFLYRKHN